MLLLTMPAITIKNIPPHFTPPTIILFLHVIIYYFLFSLLACVTRKPTSTLVSLVYPLGYAVKNLGYLGYAGCHDAMGFMGCGMWIWSCRGCGWASKPRMACVGQMIHASGKSRTPYGTPGGPSTFRSKYFSEE